jgi:hypothetical protein
VGPQHSQEMDSAMLYSLSCRSDSALKLV